MAQVTNTQILKELKSIQDILNTMAQAESARCEREKNNEELLHTVKGNSKPGFTAIRDKVLSWEVKSNAIILLVVGDIVMRVIQGVK